MGHSTPVNQPKKHKSVTGKSTSSGDHDGHKSGHESYDKGGLVTANGNADTHNKRRSVHRAEHTAYSSGVHKTIADRRDGKHHDGDHQEHMDGDGGNTDQD